MFIGGTQAIDWNNLATLDSIGGLMMLAVNLIGLIALIVAAVVGTLQYRKENALIINQEKKEKEHKKVYYAILANSIHRYDHK